MDEFTHDPDDTPSLPGLTMNFNDTSRCDFVSLEPSPFVNTNSPPLDRDGSIQCAQPSSTVHFTPRPMNNNMSYQLDEVILDRIDNELEGIPKDQFINRLLESTDSSEEMLSNYRSELSKRAKRVCNTPLGMLKDRRKTRKESASMKYANDCFLLKQYLDGNIQDISNIFRKGAEQSDCQAEPTSNSGSISDFDIRNIKETISVLQADVIMLKRQLMESEKKCDSMNKDINDVKCDLVSCAATISQHLKDSSLQDDSPNLAKCLRLLTTRVQKLQESSNSTSSKVSEIQTSVRDNTILIGNINDNESASKNKVKLQMKDLTEKIDSDGAKLHQYHIKNQELENSLKSLSSKLKNSEHRNATPNADNIERSFNNLAQDMGAKFQIMCQNIEISMKNMSSAICSSIVRPTQPPSEESPSNSSQFDTATHSDSTALFVASKVQPQSTSSSNNHVPCATTPATSKNDIMNITSTDNTTRKDLVNTSNCTYYTQYLPATSNSDITNITSTDNTTRKHLVNTSNCTDYTQDQPNTNHGLFRGVVRRRAKSYIITGIDLDSNENGIHDFLFSLDVPCKSVKFLFTRRTDCKVAQIIVDENYSEIIENPNIWPSGIFCRPWMKKTDYMSRHRRFHSRNQSENDNIVN
ncbi:hypothetical protein ACF0H5_019332 [Mactra antiquata]